MTISDIITLISLVIAIVALISERNRKHLLLKFQYVDYVVLAIAFLLINYFVFYHSFYARGWYIKQLYFNGFGLKNPKNYAYITSLMVLAFLYAKFELFFYPSIRRAKVIAYYRQLLENGETTFLMDLIERYHKNDIIRVLRTPIQAKKDDDLLFEAMQEKFEFKELLWSSYRMLFPNSWSNRRLYGETVLHGIIADVSFIAFAANMRPYFFSQYFFYFKQNINNVIPDDLINLFFAELLEQKNHWLKKELLKSTGNDYGQPEWFWERNKLLSSLLCDLDVAKTNKIWKPFGESAQRELRDELQLGKESKLLREPPYDEFLWEYRLMYSIQFFHILLIEAIIRKYKGTHFFLAYYWYLGQDVLKVIDNSVSVKIHDNTLAIQFIKIITHNLYFWVQLCVSNENKERYFDILRCWGNLLNDICNNSSVSDDIKISEVSSLMTLYCTLDNSSVSDSISAEILKHLNKPCALTKSGGEYYRIMKLAWRKFDKVPYRDHSGNNYSFFQKLIDEVIIPIGITP